MSSKLSIKKDKEQYLKACKEANYIILILFFLPIIVFSQEKISVHDIRSIFNDDLKDNCITVDTIIEDPFTGIIYLSYYQDRCEPLKAIIHYEEGLRDGADIDLGAQSTILRITNYSKGEWKGVQYFNNYPRATYSANSFRSKYEDSFFNRQTCYWTKMELVKGGFINKNEQDLPFILKYDIRRNKNGKIIYKKYYNAEGKEVSKFEYLKLNYLAEQKIRSSY